MKRFIALGLCLSLLFVAQGAEALNARRHSEDVEGLGKVVFVTSQAYSWGVDSFYLMNELLSTPDLKVVLYARPFTKEELEAYQRGEEPYPEYEDHPVTMSQEEEERMFEKMKKFKRVSEPEMVMDPDFLVDNKISEEDIPSFFYFAPDKKLYQFPFVPFQTKAAAAQFRMILEEYKRKPKKRNWTFGEE